MKDAKRLPNYDLFREPRNRAIRELNNIFVVTQIAQEAVKDAHTTLQSGRRTKLRFSIPTVQREKIVAARNKSDILSLLEQTINRDLFAQALVPAVAVTEGYLADMLSIVLRAFPKKLGSSEKKVDLPLVLESSDLEELLGKIISNQIYTAFYASPVKYFMYIEDTLSVSIPEARKKTYAEVKATRDICVHNGGVANKIYVEKSGDRARAEDGEPLPLDQTYFSSAIMGMKGIVQSAYSELLKKYGKSKNLRSTKRTPVM